ncbi:MAG: SMC-Scp complex subunit ScpB [Deltaproteobacteria bacterium RIFCSPHIGHO2_12_FULL_43_9]|nr:MAG: SMC-Scp complex subunit ScpB [Deltaproteobacteria bacterium RIFCSPHIGHO2_12_FULL_43_9]
MNPQLNSIIEGMLFASEHPVQEKQLIEILSDRWDPVSIANAIEELRAIYEKDDRVLSLVKVAAGYQFRTKPALAPYIRKLYEQKPQRLTQAAVEVMAIVAYRQPVTRHEIDKIRGVDGGPLLRSLLERKLVRILGRSETPGRPLIYGTTKEFLEFFGLPDLASLPSLRDVKDLGRDQQEMILEEIKDDPILTEQTRALFERSEFMQALEDPNNMLDTAFISKEIKGIKVEPFAFSLAKEEEAIAFAEVGEEEEEKVNQQPLSAAPEEDEEEEENSDDDEEMDEDPDEDFEEDEDLDEDAEEEEEEEEEGDD